MPRYWIDGTEVVRAKTAEQLNTKKKVKKTEVSRFFGLPRPASTPTSESNPENFL
jgi:hypothetical protein